MSAGAVGFQRFSTIFKDAEATGDLGTLGEATGGSQGVKEAEATGDLGTLAEATGGVRECRGVAGGFGASGEGFGSSCWDPRISPWYRGLESAAGPAAVRGSDVLGCRTDPTSRARIPRMT